MSRSFRAGLIFPVGRTHRALRKGNYASRIGAGAPVFLAAVLEYVLAELLENAGNVAAGLNKKRIVPRHITLAIKSDQELDELLSHVIISEGGVQPHINPILLPKSTKKKDEWDYTYRNNLKRWQSQKLLFIIIYLSIFKCIYYFVHCKFIFLYFYLFWKYIYQLKIRIYFHIWTIYTNAMMQRFLNCLWWVERYNCTIVSSIIITNINNFVLWEYNI